MDIQGLSGMESKHGSAVCSQHSTPHQGKTHTCIHIYIIYSTHILLKASVGAHMTIRFARCTARGNSEKLTELLPKVRPWSQGNHNLRADPSQAASNMLFRMLTDHGVIFWGQWM